jgi:hypothetical protein
MDTHTTDRSFGLRLECEQITRRQVCMIIEPLSLTDDAVMAGLGSLPSLHRIFRRHRIATTQVDQNQ